MITDVNTEISEEEFKARICSIVENSESRVGYIRTCVVYRALDTGKTVHTAIQFIKADDPLKSLETNREGELKRYNLSDSLAVFSTEDYIQQKNGICYELDGYDVEIDKVQGYLPVVIVEFKNDIPVDITADGVAKALEKLHFKDPSVTKVKKNESI